MSASEKLLEGLKSRRVEFNVNRSGSLIDNPIDIRISLKGGDTKYQLIVDNKHVIVDGTLTACLTKADEVEALSLLDKNALLKDLPNFQF